MESEALQHRILAEGVKPYGRRIANVTADGSIAAVVFEPKGDVEKFARKLGWEKYHPVPVFRLSPEIMANMAAADRVTAAWLARSDKSIARIIVFTGLGSLLLNFEPSRGYWLEPESTDGEQAQARN